MADKQETSNRGGKSGVNLPLVVLGIITEIYSHARAKTAENHQRQTNENALVRSAKRTSAATIWIAIFGLCTVAAALAQIIVFYFQWRELNRSNDINWRVYVGGERARIGPTSGTFQGDWSKGPISLKFLYGNTGRDAAQMAITSQNSDFSREWWKNGNAAADITRFQQSCLAMTKLPQGKEVITAYPTTGPGSYQFTEELDTPFFKTPDATGIANGNRIMTLKGCIVYLTIGEIHHSAFCYYYWIPEAPRTF